MNRIFKFSLLISLLAGLLCLSHLAFAQQVNTSTNLFEPGKTSSAAITTRVMHCSNTIIERVSRSGHQPLVDEIWMYVRGCACTYDYRRNKLGDRAKGELKHVPGIGSSCAKYARSKLGVKAATNTPYSNGLDVTSEVVYGWTTSCWNNLKNKTIEGYTVNSGAAAQTCSCVMDAVRSQGKRVTRFVMDKYNTGKDILKGLPQEKFNTCFERYLASAKSSGAALKLISR